MATCKASNASVYLGGFEKIEIQPPGSGPALLVDLQSAIKSSTKTHHAVLDHKKLQYTYMRPFQDIIVMKADTLVKLYLYGGSINLDRFAHIAVYGLDLDEKTLLLKLIQFQCPNLKRLSIVLYNDLLTDEPADYIRLLDINDNLNKEDLWDYSGNRVSQAYPVSTVKRS